MPILMPSTKTLTRSIENITKNGINIDEIVRNSIRCDIKGSLKKDDSEELKATRKVRVPLKETSLRSVASSTTANNCSGKRNLQTKTIDHKRKRCRTSCNKYPKKDAKTDGMKKENLIKEEPVDDSLTSLQWLTGVKVGDILEGRPIQYSPPSPAPSSSSEDGEDRRCSGHNGYGPNGAIDYRKEKEVKPPYSYAVLIIMAMKSKTCGKMTLSEIYKWISENFVFYRNAEPTWQNSIRHNLSLNKCFAKIPRQKGDTGKGGYWTMVPEYANKLLENSIRKRRSNVYHYDANDVVKRQRLDVLENQLLCDIKAEMQPTRGEEEQLLPKTLLEDITLSTYNNSPIGLKNMEYCRMDHSYGKSPVVNYNVSDVENIRAIATHLEDTTSNVGVCSEDISLSTHTTFSSTLRTDCIWSAEQNDNLSESMATVTEELLEAQNIEGTENAMLKTLNNSLNSSNGFDSLFYCLSPPISGDDDYYSDDLEDIDPHSPVLCDDDMQYLAIRGTSMTLFEPTPEITKSSDYDVKLEPSSPESIDLNE